MTAQIRYTKKQAIVLCELGHLVYIIDFDENYPGSYSQMLLSFRKEGDMFDTLADKCQGYGHAEGEKLK